MKLRVRRLVNGLPSLEVTMNPRVRFEMVNRDVVTEHLVCGYAHFKMRKTKCCRNFHVFVILEDPDGEDLEVESVYRELQRRDIKDMYTRSHIARFLGEPHYYVRLHKCEDELMAMKCIVFTFGTNSMCPGCARDGRMPYRLQMEGNAGPPADNVEALALAETDDEAAEEVRE